MYPMLATKYSLWQCCYQSSWHIKCEVVPLVRSEKRNSSVTALFLEKKAFLLWTDSSPSVECIWSRSLLPSVGSTVLWPKALEWEAEASKAHVDTAGNSTWKRCVIIPKLSNTCFYMHLDVDIKCEGRKDYGSWSLSWLTVLLRFFYCIPYLVLYCLTN